jgi:hypothetical protein
VKVVAYVPDLMDRSRFGQVAAETTFVNDPNELAAVSTDTDVAIADLGRPGSLEALMAAKSARKIGFVSHENSEMLQRAASEGIEAMARSRFLPRIAQIVATG